MSETVDTTVPGPLPVKPDSTAGATAQDDAALAPTAALLAEAALSADVESDETFMVAQVEVDEPDLEPLPSVLSDCLPEGIDVTAVAHE